MPKTKKPELNTCYLPPEAELAKSIGMGTKTRTDFGKSKGHAANDKKYTREHNFRKPK